MIDLAGCIAVVTGASSGIGRRLALDFAADGATVIALARREELLTALAEEMRATSPASGFAVCDVSDVDGYRAVLAGVEKEHGRVDVLVNCAGIERRSPALADDSEKSRDLGAYREILETNFFAAVAGTLEVLPGMVERGFGVVVNVSSDSARAPSRAGGAYAASKAALSAFTEAAGHEVFDRGVRLHVLYPGWVPTAMGMRAVDEGLEMPPRIVRRSEAQVSSLVRRKMGSDAIELNAAKAAVFAPLMRSLLPRVYRSQMSRR